LYFLEGSKISILILFENVFKSKYFNEISDYENVIIAKLSNEIDFDKSYINKNKYLSSTYFNCQELDEQIERESEKISRLWAEQLNAGAESPFLYKNYDLTIPSIHIMGIGMYPENYFHCAVRGLRYTQQIIKTTKPDKIVLIDDNSPAIIGSLIAVKNEYKSINITSIKQPTNKSNIFYKNTLKPILRFGRDVALTLRNSLLKIVKNSKSNKQILFFPIWYNRIRLMKPVLDELSRRDYQLKIITSLKDRHKGKMLNTLKSLIIPYNDLNNYIDFNSVKNIVKNKKGYSCNSSKEKSLFWSDKLLESLISRLNNDAFDYYKNNYYYNFIRSVEIIENIFKDENPNLLLFNTDEASLGKITSIVSQNYNIPVINIDHALQIDSPRITNLLYTKMAVAGSLNKDLFIKYGAKEKQIAITGLPIHDMIYNINSNKNFTKDEFLKKLNLPLLNNKNVVLFTHPNTRFGNRETRKKIIENVISAVQKHTNINLIIKLHPNENDRLVENIISQNTFKHVSVLQDVNSLYNLINFGDLIITTYNSTVAIEAALFKKPLIILNYTGQKNLLKCSNEGVAVEVINSDNLYDIFVNQLNNHKINNSIYEEFEKKYAYKIDGNSSFRVSELIENTIKNYV